MVIDKLKEEKQKQSENHKMIMVHITNEQDEWFNTSKLSLVVCTILLIGNKIFWLIVVAKKPYIIKTLRLHLNALSMSLYGSK